MAGSMKLIMEGWRSYLSEGLRSPGFDVNATAGANDVGDPNIEILVTIDGEFDPDSLYLELIDTVVHEMTHLGQASFDKVGKLCGPSYFACLTETEAFASGLLARAEESNQDVTVVIDEYLQSQVEANRLKVDKVSDVKDVWLNQLPKLNRDIEAEKKLYALDAVPQIIETVLTQVPASDVLYYQGYKYIADIDETDEFTIEYTVEYI